jgi:hypothetical protein
MAKSTLSKDSGSMLTQEEREALYAPRVQTVADLIEMLQHWPPAARVSLVNMFTSRYQDIRLVGINPDRDHVMIAYTENPPA